MDAAILSCEECLFSQRVQELLKDFITSLELNGLKIDIKLQSYDLKQIEHHAVAADVHRSKVQIVIISNHFIGRLQHEASNRKKLSPINRVLRPKRVIAVLVQLTAEDVAEHHQNVLPRFHEWHVVEMKSFSKPNLEPEFCTKMSEQITKIYNAELSNTSNFIIFPTKVTKDQPKIAILFKKPVVPGESVRFELSRGNKVQIMEDIHTTNPCSALIRVPDVLCTDKSGLIEITPFVNKHKMGTKLVKYEYHAKQIDEDVIERMSQALPGFQKLLDSHISQALSRNFRLCEDFALDPSLELLNDTLISREDDFPTVMHMACYYGLERTVWILLEEGDGLEQCAVRNDMNETPLDIAQAKGYESTIGQTIKDYKEVNFTWKALQYVKDLYERQSNEVNEHENGAEFTNGDTEQDNQDIITIGIETKSDEDKECDTESQENSQSEEVDQNVDEAHENESAETSSQPENEEEVFPIVSPLDYDIHSNLSVKQKRLTLHEYLMMGPPPPLLAKPQVVDQNYYDVVPAGPERVAFPVDGNDSPAANALMKKISNLTIDNDYLVVQQRISTETTQINGSKSAPSYPQVVQNPVFGLQQKSAPNSTSSDSSATPASNPTQVLLDASDENLLELMNNYKDNVYTLQQLQLLFENWKSRSDVQKDMEEKQKDLQRIRDEYRKIQENSKKSKKSSLKFFTGKKKSTAGLTHSNTTPAHGSDHSKEISGPLLQSSDPAANPPKPPISIPVQVLKTDAEKTAAPTPIWKNPHDGRFFTSYVEPSPNAQPNPKLPSAPTTPEILEEPESPPPPRPAKKISNTMAPNPICLSPSALGYVKKPPPPPPQMSPTPKLSFVNYKRSNKKK